MTKPTPIKLESLMEEFVSLDAYFQSVHEILEEGHMPDIAGLRDRVASVCEHVTNAEKDIQRKCKPHLQSLIKKLDTCEAEMTAFHNAFLNGRK